MTEKRSFRLLAIKGDVKEEATISAARRKRKGNQSQASLDVIPVSLSNNNDSSLTLGVFESELDGDASTRLQFYSSDIELDCDVIGNSSYVLENKPKEKQPKSKKKYREPTRLSLEDRIRCIRLCSRYRSLADVQRIWRQSCKSEPPCRKTMAALNDKFEQTGSVADLTRTGRPKSTRNDATVARVEDAVRKDPNKSIRTLAKELGINQAAVHRIKRNYEDNRSILKNENKKLKDKLNEALKRIMLLERRVSSYEQGHVLQLKADNSSITATAVADDVETLVLASSEGVPLSLPGGGTSLITTTGQIETRPESSLPSILSVNGTISIPPVLRLQQAGHEIHIITIPQQGPSQQLGTLNGNSILQLPTPSVSVPLNDSIVCSDLANTNTSS